MNPQNAFAELFAPENAAPDASAGAAAETSWKVLLVDDEPDIHGALHMALRQTEVEGRPLTLLDADSAEEAKVLLRAHPEIGLILLDVVMETESAGLDLVRFVRQEQRNRSVQIVILTGQPGYAPQRQVVAGYEIDGYRLKSELTAERIYVMVYTALRTHLAMRTLESQRRELELMAQTLHEREERLRSVVESAPDAIILVDEAGLIQGWNEGATQLFGYSRQETEGMSFTMLQPPELRAAALSELGRISAGESSELLCGRAFESTGQAKDGSRVPLEVVLGSWVTERGRNFSAIARGIRRRKQQESELRLAASVFAHSPEGILIADARHIIQDVNPAFTRITGFPREEVVERPVHAPLGGVLQAEIEREMQKSLEATDFWQGELENRRRDGTSYPAILSVSAVRDPKRMLTHTIHVLSDISTLKAHEQELIRVANYDTLTGLPNRRLLADLLRQAMAHSRRTNRSLAVCYLDLDGFKHINDELGHAVGDRLLVEIAERLKFVLREEDTLARLGGDEFVFLLGNLSQSEDYRSALTRILQSVRQPVRIEGKTVTTSVSIGVTLFPADDVDADTLLRHGDQAMYLAKELGKNRYHFFDAEHDRAVITHRLNVDRLAQALTDGELVLHYQPKVDLLTGTVIGAEALIRWLHPERGLLYPGDFLRFAEGNRLESALGEWVIAEAMRQITLWKRDGLAMHVSVNVSANHLLQESFAERLQYLFQKHPEVTPDSLELEMLETTGLSDMKRAANTLGLCRKMGVWISLDDFGTGYSSLTYFLKLPVQILKMDQSFVRGMLDDPNELGIVEGVVRLAHAFNRPVIAEGVETMEHGAMLLKLGCRLAQGYGIARPMEPERLPEWVNQWRQSAPWLRLDASKPDSHIALAVACHSHERWLSEVQRLCQNPQEEFNVILDSNSCAFGRWYVGSGSARYGAFSAYSAIGPLHEQVHRLAAELLRNRMDCANAQHQMEELQQVHRSIQHYMEQLEAGNGEQTDHIPSIFSGTDLLSLIGLRTNASEPSLFAAAPATDENGAEASPGTA